jgi:hypothetical protein
MSFECDGSGTKLIGAGAQLPVRCEGCTACQGSGS